MLGYFDIFPDKAKTELRTVTLLPASEGESAPLLDGTFLFTEYFCTDLNCDCQRVLVKVLRVESVDDRPEEVATINYSWNPNGDEMMAFIDPDAPNPFLDPLHQQTPCADELLELWDTMMKRDRAYASRIQRHYDELRAEVGEEVSVASEMWGQLSASDVMQESPTRPLTKQNRKDRQKRLANACKRKRAK